MIPLSIFSHRIVILALIAAVSSLAFGLFLYRTDIPFARAFGYGSAQTSGGTVHPSEGSPAAISSAEEEPIREVHIANNGLMLLRGARVESISGTTLHVEMTWGGLEFSWSIQTDTATKFFGAQGEKDTLAGIHRGDIVTITGTLVGNGREPVVEADFIRK